MPGSATLDPDVLVDGLLGTVDELRDLGRTFGIRAYRLYRVVRTWDGGAVGEGEATDELIEILPRPKVEPFTESLANKLEPCGLMEAGVVKVTELSLTYTFPELAGTGLAAGVEQLLLLREGYGQEQPDRYATLDRPPFPDREEEISWILWLRIQQATTP